MYEMTDNVHQANDVPRNRLGLWLLIPLAMGVIALFVFSWKWKDSLKIHRVIVVGTHILKAQDVFGMANISTNSPMYQDDISGVVKRIGSQPFVKSVLVNRQLPNAIRIEIVEREPIASLSNGQLQYVDTEGVLLPYNQSSVQFDLPMISGVRNLKNMMMGKTVENKDLTQAIEVLRTALSIDSAVYHLISEVKMGDEDNIVLYSSEGGVPINLGRGEIPRKLLTLQKFWNGFVKPGDADKLKYIDLRFDGQVVAKWNRDGENVPRKYSL